MTRKEIYLKTIARMGKEIKATDGQAFISAYVRNQRKIVVPIANVYCKLAIRHLPRNVSGFGRFTISGQSAIFEGPAGRKETRSYLTKFPPVFVVLAHHDVEKSTWTIVSATRGQLHHFPDTRRLLLPSSRLQLFDTVVSRYDGLNHYFQAISRHSSRRAGTMRETFVSSTASGYDLRISGITPGERAAFDYCREANELDEETLEHNRVESAISGLGGQLESYEVVDSSFYRVVYRVDNRKYTTLVDREHLLAVGTTGVCLSGQDSNFNLTSLVPVLRRLVNENPEYGAAF